MGRDVKFFRLGVFVLVSIACFVVAVLILGGSEYFEEKIICETYIDGSVQGLDVGMPVKFRGVTFGKVEKIDLVSNIYDINPDSPAFSAYGRYVYIQMSITPENVANEASRRDVKAIVDRYIKDGLRARLAMAGLTGGAYIELEYLDPQLYPMLDIDWEPKTTYIPSAKDTVSRFFDSIETVLANLEQVDVARLITDVNDLVVAVTDTLNEDVRPILREVGAGSDAIPRILVKVEGSVEKLDKLLASVDRAVAGNLDQVMVNLNEGTADLPEMMQKVNGLLVDVDGFLETLGTIVDEEISPAMANVKSATDEVPETIAHLKGTLRQTNQLIASGSVSVGQVLDNLRSVLADLKKLTSTTKEYPSYLLFGEAPEPVRPGK